MRRIGRKLAGVSILALCLVLAGGGVMAYTLYTRAADSFATNGNLISGWYWLRSTSHYAEWTWNAGEPRQPRDACLNFSVLVTNQTSGGSGYECNLRVRVLDLQDNLVTTRTLSLDNYFRPINSTNTGGVGYQAYGATCSVNIGRTVAEGFKVRVEWPPLNRTYHVAVNQGSVGLAYNY